MVTETKETMNKAFETMNDGMKTAVDCTQRTQETFFRFMRDSWRNPGEFDKATQRGERMMKQFLPFMGETIETFTKACDANVRAGMGVFKTICDTATHTDEADFGKKTRQVWDATFEAVRTNFDVMSKMSTKAMENYSAFCESAFCDDAQCSRTQPNRPAGKNEKSNGH
jgi:hypothetical protein